MRVCLHVPPQVVVTMIVARLAQRDCVEKGWLLDGYPRSASQADALAAAGITPDVFLLLEVGERGGGGTGRGGEARLKLPRRGASPVLLVCPAIPFPPHASREAARPPSRGA